jgi:hypothetical protein
VPLAEYYDVQSHLAEEPAFAWKAPNALQECNRTVAKVKNRTVGLKSIDRMSDKGRYSI